MYLDFATMDESIAKTIMRLIEKLYLPVQFVDKGGKYLFKYYTFSFNAFPDAVTMSRYIEEMLFAKGVHQLCGFGFVGRVDKEKIALHLSANYSRIASEGNQAAWLWRFDYIEAIIREGDEDWSIDIVPSPYCRDCVDIAQARQLLSAFVAFEHVFLS